MVAVGGAQRCRGRGNKNPERSLGCIGNEELAPSPYLLESRKGTSTTPPFLGHLLLVAENSRKGL